MISLRRDARLRFGFFIFCCYSQKFSLVKFEKYFKLCFRFSALCAAATHTNCLPVGNEQSQLDGFGFSLDWLSKREREPHRTRAKNELKLNSNSPSARAELSRSWRWRCWFAKSRRQRRRRWRRWRRRAVETWDLCCSCVSLYVCWCWLLGNFAAHTLRCAAAASLPLLPLLLLRLCMVHFWLGPLSQAKKPGNIFSLYFLPLQKIFS